MPGMYIRDPLFGDIHINDVAQRLIDNEWMQRLRYIKQLGFDYLVYPAANHSRFEHSLGTMKVTSDMASKIFSEDDPELSIAGLMHDIGHTPFSHQSEDIATKYLKKTHEEIGASIISESSIHDVISESTLSLKKF
jgi:HD superfamily phosphohydrolases